MMSFCLGQEILIPDPAVPLGDWLSIYGLNSMKAPFRAIAGTRFKPGYTWQGNPNYGFYLEEGKVGVTLLGRPSVLFSPLGLEIIQSNFSGLLTHSNTADRTYTLPDEDGELLVGGSATEAESQMTIEITDGVAQEVLPEFLARKGGLITFNIGNGDVWLGLTPDTVVGNVEDANGGWPLRKGSSSFNLSVLTGYKGPIYGCCETGKSAIVAAVQW